MKQVFLTGVAAALTVSAASHLSVSEANPEAPAGANKVAQGSDESAQSQATQATTAVKVGERQTSNTDSSENAAIATIKLHQSSGRQAATIYVRNIPIVTFLGKSLNAAEAQGVKVATLDPDLGALTQASTRDMNDPVWRAATIAGKINQFNESGLDAKAIKVQWNGKRNSYLIQTKDQHLIEVSDNNTVLPGTTK
ncbi:MAG TPA: hypothetical protein V6D19_13160, partial [Stenomitos sp.]